MALWCVCINYSYHCIHSFVCVHNTAHCSVFMSVFRFWTAILMLYSTFTCYFIINSSKSIQWKIVYYFYAIITITKLWSIRCIINSNLTLSLHSCATFFHSCFVIQNSVVFSQSFSIYIIIIIIIMIYYIHKNLISILNYNWNRAFITWPLWFSLTQLFCRYSFSWIPF